MLYIGLGAMIIGIFLFLIPMIFNKWLRLAEIGFFVLCAGSIIVIISLP